VIAEAESGAPAWAAIAAQRDTTSGDNCRGVSKKKAVLILQAGEEETNEEV